LDVALNDAAAQLHGLISPGQRNGASGLGGHGRENRVLILPVQEVQRGNPFHSPDTASPTPSPALRGVRVRARLEEHRVNEADKLREAVGDEIDIMIDFHGRTATGQAIEYIRAVEEFRPFFCEEPVPPEQPDALLEVRRSVRVPIATGERVATRLEPARFVDETHTKGKLSHGATG
jgi:hypothetical protein